MFPRVTLHLKCCHGSGWWGIPISQFLCGAVTLRRTYVGNTNIIHKFPETPYAKRLADWLPIQYSTLY